ncbi:MAG: hypothetical protein ACE5HE_09490 [Phycisphaerae bacterium]
MSRNTVIGRGDYWGTSGRRHGDLVEVNRDPDASSLYIAVGRR